MDIERLKELVIKFQQHMNYYRNSQYNEQDCRDEFISPLLECFGWDVHNKKDVLPQYKDVVVERYSNSSERPDYTLTLNGVSKIFVEAKKPSVDITLEIDPSMQARKYGWNAKHAIAILTNFENLIIYDTTNKPKAADNINTSVYRKYNCSEYVTKYQEIYDLISHENVYNGKFDKFTKSNFQDVNRFHTEVDETFLQQINKWRLDLGQYLYSNDDRYKDINVLNDKVQEFINQVIFLRICEDRKLPLYKKLYEVAENKNKLQEILTRVFKEADKRYNSGMFKGENSIFDLNADSIFEMIQSLYYPRTPYLFTIIEPSILGKIYEAFLAEHLIVESGKVILAEKNEYKDKSVVSTPTEIVRYMVKNTLEPICNGKTPDEIIQIKVADIACGSGVFLEEAYQFLIDYCSSWYEKNRLEYLLELSNGRKKLPLKDKKQILVSCIYGVDIDIHAVEVSRFALLLKLIEDETDASVIEELPILPDLSSNIMNGNALVSLEDLSLSKTSTDELIDIVPFDWNCIAEGSKFDVILGNPPYVKTEDINKLYSKKEVAVYKKYKASYKQYDKYYLFLERSLKLVNDTGRISMIVPNKFMHVNSGEKIRQILSDYIYDIQDFGSQQLFLGKTIYSAIITISAQKQGKLFFSEVENVAELWSHAKPIKTISKGLLNAHPWKEDEHNNGEPWFITDDVNYMQIMNNNADKIVPLVDVVEIYDGIQTSAEKVYRIDGKEILFEDESIVKFRKRDKEYIAEKEYLRKYFKPSFREKGLLDSYFNVDELTRTYNIFPYDLNGNLIDKTVLEKTNLWNYLIDNKEALMPKCFGGKRDVQPQPENEDNWYQYGRRQAITSLNTRKKIIVGVNRKKDNQMYLIDENHMLIASGGTAGYVGISLKNDSLYELEYIQAWLNHPMTEFYLQTIGSDFEGGFVARGTYTLPMVPFIQLDFEQEKQKALHDKVVSCTQKIYQLNHEMTIKADKKTRNILNNEKERLINEIEQLITNVYQQKF